MSKRDILMFVLGGLAGSLSTYYYVKKRVEEKKELEVALMRDLYKKLGERKEIEERNDIQAEEIADETKSETKASYVNYAAAYTAKEVEESMTEINSSSVLAIDQFTYDDDEEFNKEILTLYSDGVLADDLDNVIKDVDELVGQNNVDELAKSEILDEVFVRNLHLKTDYHIVKGTGSYEEITGLSPDI